MPIINICFTLHPLKCRRKMEEEERRKRRGGKGKFISVFFKSNKISFFTCAATLKTSSDLAILNFSFQDFPPPYPFKTDIEKSILRDPSSVFHMAALTCYSKSRRFSDISSFLAATSLSHTLPLVPHLQAFQPHSHRRKMLHVLASKSLDLLHW